MNALKEKNVQNTVKKCYKNCRCCFLYVWTLFALLFCMLYLSMMIYVAVKEEPMIIYVSNIVIILLIMLSEKFEDTFWEKCYYKAKEGGFIKRHLKKVLIDAKYKPSAKVALYAYYLLCIAAERSLYFGVADNIMDADLIAGLIDFLSMTYYSFIFLMALDKVIGAASKEYKNRKKYYAKFEE